MGKSGAGPLVEDDSLPRKGSVRFASAEHTEHAQSQASSRVNVAETASTLLDGSQGIGLDVGKTKNVSPIRWWQCLARKKNKKQRKPASNPPGWAAGKTTDYELAKRPNRVVVINAEQETEFVPNMVRTAKYDYYSFLPMFLWEEFNPTHKIANVYFLFIAGLQVIPSITNTFGIPLMLLPLFFVVCVDAVFMIVEDVARHRADNFANSSLTRAWDRRTGDFKLITWKEIEVGDLIVINNREAVPCDVLIVGVDEPVPTSPAGIAYVETKSLDGETNLKIRQVVKGALGALVVPEDCASLSGRVVMEHPDKLINNFKGKLLLDSPASPRSRKQHGSNTKAANAASSLISPVPPEEALTAPEATRGSSSTKPPVVVGDLNVTRDDGEGLAGGIDLEKKGATIRRGTQEVRIGGTLIVQGPSTEPITPDVLLLRGCVLRNTRWVVGLVLNTGPDTKIMMSMSKAPSKVSHLSARINEEIKRVAALMATVCLLGAAVSTIWSYRYLEDKWYLRWEDAADQLAGMFFTQILYYALLLNSFIPISLYVSMNFVRFLQSWFMNQDLDMYYPEADMPARVRTMNLNEDLGQVSHVFSDKTGTLTCNIMDFRKFSVGGVSYGLGITEIGRAAMMVEGETIPADVLEAEEEANNHAAPHVNFYDPSVYQDLQGQGSGGKEQARKIGDFFMALALCHTVIPEKFEDSDEVILSASSPDDEALVLGAKYFGFEFADRVDSSAIVNRWNVTSPPLSTKTSRSTSSFSTAPADTSHGGGAAGGKRRIPSSSHDSTGDVTGGDTPSEALSRDRSSSSIDAGDNPIFGERNSEVLPGDGVSRGGASMGGGGGGGGGGGTEVTRGSYEVLHLLGFTSDRKRMSVIIRDEKGGIKIICKGADTTMLPRLRTDYPGEKELIETTVKHMDKFAREGLRTLVVAQAELDPDVFEEWADLYEEASNDLVEIEKKNAGEPNRIDDIMERVECNLEIIGSSAIEDKLQAGVSDAVMDLMTAGIKIWVLTGDKEETAINIAVACQLLWTEDKMRRIVINLKGHGESETEEIKQALEDFLETYIDERNKFEQDETGKVEAPLPRGLVIDGPALLEAMQTPESQRALLRAAQTCHSVVGCRLSPDQKRALVSLVRENVPGTRTLSIGDGANDVPMIQTAHIGVGISGQEGMQAVNASDYAISQFAFLRKLLLVHGRWNYRRSSRVVCYLFYKSVMFACPLIFYAFVNGFSGTLFYDYVTSNLYAVVYTALPILLYGTYDRDISADTCLRFPRLYAYGIQDGCMRPRIFWYWMLQAVVESAFLTLAPSLLLSGDLKSMGVVTTSYDYGTTTFTLVVLTVSIKMFWVQYRWTSVHVLAITGSVLAFFLSAFVVNASVVFNWEFFGVLSALLQSRPFWAVLVWCLVVVTGRDLAWKFYQHWWRPRLHHLVMESEKNERIAAFAPHGKTAGEVVGVGVKPGEKKGCSDENGLGRLDLEDDPEAAVSHLMTAPTGTAKNIHNERGDGASHGRQHTALSTPKTPAAPTSHHYARSADLASSLRNNSVNGDNDNTNTGALSVRGFLESTFTNTPSRVGAPQNQASVGGTDSQPAGVRCRQHRRAATGGDGVDNGGKMFGNNWARTLGWIESNKPHFGGNRRNENFSAIDESPAPREGAQAFVRDETDDPFSLVLGRRRSVALARAGGELGQDPREAAKLMKKTSFFVEVERLSTNEFTSSRSTFAGLPSVSARRKSDVSTHRHRGSDSNIIANKHRGKLTASTGSRTALHPPVSTLSLSSGGYAFSCDPQAQQAEIAMIMGERPAPIHQTADFYQQRSSLRAQRIERARDNIAGEEKCSNNETIGSNSLGHAGTGGTHTGLAGLAPLQRRNSFSFGSEHSSSTSPLAGHGSGPRERRDTIDAPEGIGSHVQQGSWVGEPQLLPALQLIVEEKLSDEGMIASPTRTENARQDDRTDPQRKPSS